MKRQPLRQIADYFILVVIVSISIILVMFFNGNRNSQKTIIVGMSILYVLWGMYHHKKENSLYKEVILEYLLLSTIGCILAVGLL